MKKNKLTIKAITLAVITTLAMLCFTGCTTWNSFNETFLTSKGAAADVIRIGVLEPMTGNDSKAAEAELEGIQLANKLHGKVNGKKVQLVYGDTQSSIYATESAVKDLIGKKPAVILGPYGNSSALTAASHIENAKIPAISLTSKNPLITKNNSYYFRISFSESSQGEAISQYAYDNAKVDNATIIRIDGDDSVQPLVTNFTRNLEKLTSKENVVTNINLDRKDKSYKKYTEKIVKDKPKIVFMAIPLTNAEKFFEDLDGTKGWSAKETIFLAPQDWHNDQLLKLTKKLKDFRIMVSSDFSETLDEGSLHEEFVKEYHKSYGKEPSSEAALGFDGYMLAIESIYKAHSVDGFKIQQTLMETKNWKGASGNISFNQNGVPRKTISIDAVADGKFISVYKVDKEGEEQPLTINKK